MPDYSFFITSVLLSMYPFFRLYYNLKKLGSTNAAEIDILHIKVNMLIYDNEQMKTKLNFLLEKNTEIELKSETNTKIEKNRETQTIESPIDFLDVNYKGIVFDKNESDSEETKTDDSDSHKITSVDFNFDEVHPTNKKSWMRVFY